MWKEIVCPHCSDTVTKTTFYRHKKLFYNPKTRIWSHELRHETQGTTDNLDSSSDESSSSDLVDDSNTNTMDDTITPDPLSMSSSNLSAEIDRNRGISSEFNQHAWHIVYMFMQSNSVNLAIELEDEDRVFFSSE